MRANLPFQLQSFYQGFPPATSPCQNSHVWQVFLLVSARPTVTKAAPHCKNPKPWREVSSQKNEGWREDATPLPVFRLTLYFRVEKHVQNCPPESGGGGLRTSCKQVCSHQTKVVIVEATLFSCLTLWRTNKWVIGAGVLAGREDQCSREVLTGTRSGFADQEVHWESAT